MTEPTARQLEIHAWMLEYQREHSMPPTMREVAAHFGFASTTAVYDHLVLLAKKGMVSHRFRVARGWVAIVPATVAA